MLVLFHLLTGIVGLRHEEAVNDMCSKGECFKMNVDGSCDDYVVKWTELFEEIFSTIIKNFHFRRRIKNYLDWIPGKQFDACSREETKSILRQLDNSRTSGIIVDAYL